MNATDAQQHLLHNACRAVAAIDAQSQVAEMLLVLGAIRIQQIDHRPADVRPPGLKRDLVHPDVHPANQRLAFFVKHRLNRQILGVQQGVVFGLPIVGVNRLLKIAFAVKQADARKTNPQIAGRFRMVPRQYAQTAGGDWERLVKTEFGGKIGDRISAQPGAC